MNRPPVSVIIISVVFILVGVGSLFGGVSPIIKNHEVRLDSVIVTVSGLTALLSGVFMLRCANWARWLCVAWMAFHVVVSILHTTLELAIHLVVLVVLTIVLFRTSAACFRKESHSL
jgi:hypothetical protein